MILREMGCSIMTMVVCAGVQTGIADCTIHEYKDYWQDAISFDYCGLSSREIDITRTKISVSMLSGRWASERDFYSLLKDFSLLLKKLEFYASEEDGEVPQAVVDQVRGSLLEQQSRSLSSDDRFPIACFRENIERLLYACVRILENDSTGRRLPEIIFRQILPDSIFKTDYSRCTWIFEGTSGPVQRIEIFRSLVLLSIRVRDWKRKMGSNPSNIDFLFEGLQPKSIKSCLRYVNDGDYWRLAVVEKRNGRRCMGMTFVPQIQKTTFEGCSPILPIMLSSDFSMQRRRIYEKGRSVEVENLMFRGEVYNGKIVFKREEHNM